MRESKYPMWLVMLRAGRYTTELLMKKSELSPSAIRYHMTKYGVEIEKVPLKGNIIRYIYLWPGIKNVKLSTCYKCSRIFSQKIQNPSKKCIKCRG